MTRRLADRHHRPGQLARHGAFPANGVPAIADVDYFRVTPDNCPTGADSTAPTTTATTAPAAPNGTNGWFTSDVNVTLAAKDGTGSGIDKTEYRVDGGTFATYSAPIAITTPGTHTVEYRSIDKNGNIEATKTLTVKVDKVAPATTAALTPARPARVAPMPSRSADADRDRRHLRRRQERVHGQLTARPSARSAPRAGRRGGRVGRPTTRPTSRRSRRPAPTRSTTARLDNAGNVEAIKTVAFTIRPRTTTPRPGHDRDAGPGLARRGPHLPGAGHGQVLGQRPGSGRPGGQDVQRQRLRRSPGPGDAEHEQRRHASAGTSRRRRRFPHDAWMIAPGGNPRPAAGRRSAGVRQPGRPVGLEDVHHQRRVDVLCSLHSSFSDGE